MIHSFSALSFPPRRLSLSTSSQWYTLCNHEWSFLEGEKRHSRTLKAGIHQFPFQLQLGGSLPSSINGYGGASVSYKLRAVAVRPGLAHNLQAVIPITILRIFAPEALEYQQSLEIENTWPGKLMYSILIPHKAWAAGDMLTAVVKFSPIAKGVRVLAVTTTINETTKLFGKSGVQEHTRNVVTTNHEVLNGSISLAERPDGIHGPPFLPTLPEERLQSFGFPALANQDLSLRQVPSRASSSSSSSSSHESHPVPAPSLPSSGPPAPSAEPEVSTSTSAADDGVPTSQDDIVAQLTLFIPKFVTPSHALEPINVTHRIRWSILMSNLDGHTSELRCSLPLHILDARLLDEARANSAATRRLLLGVHEAPVDEEHDTELPSYSAHVRDRVANMYLPDSATARVLNPWVHSNVSPTFTHDRQSLSGSWTPPDTASPVIPHPVSSHLPHAPQSGTSTPLEWVNSELLLSLSNTVTPPPRTNPSPHSHSLSESFSRPESRLVSRRNSRAPSPERRLSISTLSPLALSSISTTSETFLHNGHASRTLPGLFNIRMKPHTSLTSPGWLSSRSHSLASLAELGHAHRGSIQSLYSHTPRQSSVSTVMMPTPVSTARVPTPTPSPTESVPEWALWHRAFTEVPDYDVASRGFIGGVTPLTSMRGLPSYEEAERSANGGGDVNADEDRLTIRRGASRQEPVAQ